MSEIRPDDVHRYRPGPGAELPLDPDETVQAVFTADRRRYWRDHLAMAGLGIVVASLGLALFGRAHTIPAGVLGVVAAVGLRGLYLASEAFARRWQLTDRRLIGPQGRQVMLLEIETVRRLMGDVQIVSRDGQKHLIKHLADPQAVLDTILDARDARARHLRNTEEGR
ncbi:hypothetical protein [Phaeovulum vinaykumarii]|uniref:Uncharacterized protein n=1 Tax=Phaeovulum vinaykumarii TaxID=407234 RepID=A0A1N7LVW1_9RHOB|nr:hypothetical protein [Phaeovulum vinaykumarii]SIS77942.1 hypothetical protein SAMN05421795_104178 [Phaeovulum vinaykumarii]SOC07233.1 hypothetical protein SAMN05878426_10476 [Phaeovulum vinaykumarii]